MRTIIAGSRSIKDIEDIMMAVFNSQIKPTVVLSGGASGADSLGEDWALKSDIPLEIYPADWEHNGKAAGYIRNQEMAENADALIAIWDGMSKGTKHMIDIATKKGLKVFVYQV